MRAFLTAVFTVTTVRLQSWSPYHPLNTHTSPWPSRLASAFSEDPSTASERLSREFEGRMSLEGSRASMDAQSTVSTTACMPHHVTETIAEEEQEEVVESQGEQGEEGSWAAAATPATVSVGGEEGGEAGQNWNWAWLAGQLPPEHGTNDPSTLLDDESEGELSIPYVSDWWASCLCIQYVFHFCRSCDACQTKTYYRDHEGQ
jgi:hypothetical protein